MDKKIKDLVKKYGLIKYGDYYRWEVSGISTMGYVLKVVGDNSIMMAGNIYVESNWASPHIEHNLWLEVESWNIENRLIKLKKQWEDAVIKMKEYKMKEKMERIEGDF